MLKVDCLHANLYFYTQKSMFGILHANKKLKEFKTGLGDLL